MGSHASRPGAPHGGWVGNHRKVARPAGQFRHMRYRGPRGLDVIGMWGGGVARWLGYPYWDQWTETEGLASETIWGINRDRQGALWAIHNAGVSRFDESAARWRDLRMPGLSAAMTTGLAWAPDGSVWLAQARGLFTSICTGARPPRSGGNPGSRIPMSARLPWTRRNRVWAGTTNGLYLAVNRGGSLRSNARRYRRTASTSISRRRWSTGRAGSGLAPGPACFGSKQANGRG